MHTIRWKNTFKSCIISFHGLVQHLFFRWKNSANIFFRQKTRQIRKKKKKKSGFEFWRLKVANSYFPATISTNENGSFPFQQHGPIRSFEKLVSCNKFVQAASVTGRISPYQQMNKKREIFCNFQFRQGLFTPTTIIHIRPLLDKLSSGDYLIRLPDLFCRLNLVKSWTMNTLP